MQPNADTTTDIVDCWAGHEDYNCVVALAAIDDYHPYRWPVSDLLEVSQDLLSIARDRPLQLESEYG